MIVTTGASGKVGGRLVAPPTADSKQVTAVYRRPEDLLQGVRHVQVDLDDPATLKQATTGADALFLLVADQDLQAVLEAAPSIRPGRAAAAPFATVGLPIIGPGDLADVAATVLREDGHAGRTSMLTGPVPTTPAERAAAIGVALGEPVRFSEQAPDPTREQMLNVVPEPVVERTPAILGTPTKAERTVSPHVEQILGRAPRSADWAIRNVTAFR